MSIKSKFVAAVIAATAFTIFGLTTMTTAARADSSHENQVSDWCAQGIKYEPVNTPFVVPAPPDGTHWTLLVLKAGSGDGENATYPNPVPGQGYSHPSGKDNSHAILCYEPNPTTTTVAPTTTTTGATTSTTDSTTTTSSTSSTVAPTSTTTTPPTSSTSVTSSTLPPANSTSTTDETTTSGPGVSSTTTPGSVSTIPVPPSSTSTSMTTTPPPSVPSTTPQPPSSDSNQTLPATGSTVWPFVWVGALCMGLGVFTRRRAS